MTLRKGSRNLYKVLKIRKTRSGFVDTGERDLEKITVLDSFEWKRNNPKNYQEKDEALFETKKKIIVPEMILYKVKNARIDEDGSVSVGFNLHKESLRLPEEMLHHYSAFKKLKRRITYKTKSLNTNETKKPIVVLSDYWSKEYYHFLIEALSRLVLYQESLKDFTVVTSYRLKTPMHQRVFELFGIKDIVYLNRKEFLKVDECYFATFPGPPDIHRPELIKAIHQQLTRDLEANKPQRKIYLCRDKATKRKIINNEEVKEILKKFGFETVYAEDLSFDEQRKLFFETKILVTPHGAGLTNILFMQPGAKVLELKKSEWGLLKNGEREGTKYYNTYWHLCEILGGDYYYKACKAENEQETAHLANLNACVIEFKDILGQLI